MDRLNDLTFLSFRCHLLIEFVHVVVISERLGFRGQDIVDYILYINLVDFEVRAEPKLLITPSLLVKKLVTHGNEKRV